MSRAHLSGCVVKKVEKAPKKSKILFIINLTNFGGVVNMNNAFANPGDMPPVQGRRKFYSRGRPLVFGFLCR